MQHTTRVLLAGVDTLILNVKPVNQPGTSEEPSTLSDVIEKHLKDRQWQAKDHEAPVPTQWKHGEHTLMMASHGVPGWKWLLKNGLIDVMLGALLNNAALARVRFSSEYLWKRGIDTAIAETSAFFTDLLGDTLFLQVAEIHPCADVVGLDIPKDYERVFVSRAKVERPILESHLDKPVYRYHRLETLQFSGHASPMSITMYDKVREIEIKSKKTWLYPMWEKEGWSYEHWKKQEKEEKYRTTVRRIECRLKRQCLHEMDIEEVHDAIEKIPALWAYGVGHPGRTDGWLRMVTPNEEDTNRWRWETTDAWHVVQQAFSHGWRGYQDMADIQRDRKRQVNKEAAEAAIAGYTATYAAWLEEELAPDADASVVLSRLYQKMQERWKRQGVDFQELRFKKMLDYHLA